MSDSPDPRSLARGELTALMLKLTTREQVVSEERQALHAQIDALRKELVNRLREEGGVVISGSDFLDPGSAGVRGPRTPRPKTGADGGRLGSSNFGSRSFPGFGGAGLLPMWP